MMRVIRHTAVALPHRVYRKQDLIFQILKHLKSLRIGPEVVEHQCLVDCVFAHREPISNPDSLPYEHLYRIVKGSSIRASKQG